MSTYGNLIANILDDVFRDDLTAQAQTAISEAIDLYKVRPWWFLEARATASTVASQEFFPMPDDYESQLILSIDINGNKYTLTQRTMEWIEDRAVSSSLYTGNPTDFAIWDEQIRFYPIPNAAHTITMTYRRKLPELTTSSSSSAWTTEAGALIRRHASGDLADTYLRDTQLADRLRVREAEALMALTMENNLKVTTGKTRRYRSR